MNVLSLFDGMAGGLISLKRGGIPVGKYFASEIDKWAIKIAKKNHPEIIHLGDILNYQTWNLPKIDLILAGPPCQGFSCAGKGLNFNDPRSQLFFKAIEILWKYRPGHFLFENVARMNEDVRTELDELLDVKSVEIDSALISAQNRNRLYWSDLTGPVPNDKGIFLKDILETEVDEKYYLHNTPIGKRSLKYLFDGMKFDHEKSHTITATGARKFSGSSSTVLIVQVPRGKNAGGIKSKNGKCPTVSSSSWEYNNRLIFIDADMNYYVRRFTPIECERLQTLDDNYTEGVSNTQRYKMIGNGWTIDVITHILSAMVY